MFDNSLHFTDLSGSPLDTDALDTDALDTGALDTEPLPTEVLPTAALPTTGQLDTAVGLPAALDPELVDLADPGREVLLSVQPAFVQRAAVPLDVGTLADAGVLIDAPPPGGQPAGPYG